MARPQYRPQLPPVRVMDSSPVAAVAVTLSLTRCQPHDSDQRVRQPDHPYRRVVVAHSVVVASEHLAEVSGAQWMLGLCSALPCWVLLPHRHQVHQQRQAP